MVGTTDVSARNWRLLVLRGALAVLFAVLTFFWPGLTVLVLVYLFGAYALIDGVIAVAAALQRIGRQERWWAMLIVGVLGIGAGIITFVWPGITALLLLTFIGVWAVVSGVGEIIAAIQLRREIENEWMLALAGVLSVVFGALVIIFPGAGAISLAWLIAAYAFVIGVLMILLGIRLRNWRPGTTMRPSPTG